MPEFVNTEDFTTPKDRENAELLIDSYKYAIELLTNADEDRIVESLKETLKFIQTFYEEVKMKEGTLK